MCLLCRRQLTWVGTADNSIEDSWMVPFARWNLRHLVSSDIFWYQGRFRVKWLCCDYLEQRETRSTGTQGSWLNTCASFPRSSIHVLPDDPSFPLSAFDILYLRDVVQSTEDSYCCAVGRVVEVGPLQGEETKLRRTIQCCDMDQNEGPRALAGLGRRL